MLISLLLDERRELCVARGVWRCRYMKKEKPGSKKIFFLSPLLSTTRTRKVVIPEIPVATAKKKGAMFKSKKTKQQSLNVVDNLLSNYLQVSDKKILKSKEKGQKGHAASKILELNSKLGNFKKTREGLRKHKDKERKMRNKKMKGIEKINEKIVRQSKLERGDREVIDEIVSAKLADLKKIDLVSRDEDLLELQNDILTLTGGESTKSMLKNLRDKQFLERKRRAAERARFEDKVSRGVVAVGGLTPGLAQPDGDDSDDSDADDQSADDADQGALPAGFRDDFDEFH